MNFKEFQTVAVLSILKINPGMSKKTFCFVLNSLAKEKLPLEYWIKYFDESVTEEDYVLDENQKLSISEFGAIKLRRLKKKTANFIAVVISS
jgi:hypothetical protein